MPLVIAALLGLSGLIIVIYPLLGLDHEARGQTPAPASEVAEREASAKEALREVEFDYRLGNLDEPEYLQLRDRYEQRALTALKTRYEQEQALDALIDEQLDGLREREQGAPAAATAEKRQPSATSTRKPTTSASRMNARVRRRKGA